MTTVYTDCNRSSHESRWSPLEVPDVGIWSTNALPFLPTARQHAERNCNSKTLYFETGSSADADKPAWRV